MTTSLGLCLGITNDSGKNTLASPKLTGLLILSSDFCALDPEVPDDEVPEKVPDNVPELCWERGIVSRSGYSFRRLVSWYTLCAGKEYRNLKLKLQLSIYLNKNYLIFFLNKINNLLYISKVSLLELCYGLIYYKQL